MTTALVVGADKGIAWNIAKQLADRGDTVYAAIMGESTDFEDASVTILPKVDVTSGDAVSGMVKTLQESGVKVDVLYHIAGVMTLDELGKIDYDRLNWEFQINTVGPLRTIEASLPLLQEGSKVGIVTSRVGSLGDNSSGGQYSYRLSKAAANMVGLNLHHDLKKQGIAVRMLHPGMVKTDLVKDYPGDYNYISPAEAATGLIARMDELTLETAGDFRHSNGQALIW
ncbi:SDR family oxidoreductase [Sphingopyxis sp. OPL5]|uniref:1-hydroxy-2-glutathionyl-2-methyl-3-butene dehydrogenase n=1 Tax=Sphingopyxis sp. OPL5 TaxID=2486273 RepID=UPI00164E299D|nr:SDR family oxidoreductase [Sphingopyxis sp. OPL5]QNO27216.1 SDR family oxidoreductase [Sphingopyxis sp. OPL5]